MLPIFRKYIMNKWTLAIGVSLLMIAWGAQSFLLQVGKTDQASAVVGRIGSTKITAGQVANAAGEMQVISRLFSSVSLAPLLPREPLVWVLMLHDAANLGIDAGRAEAAELMVEMQVSSDEALRAAVLNLNIPPQFIESSLHHWLIVNKYREVMQGMAHVPLQDHLDHMKRAKSIVNEVNKFFQQAGNSSNPNAIQALQSIYLQGQQLVGQNNDMWRTISEGLPRLSSAFMGRFLLDARSQVKILMVPVSYSSYMSQTSTPTEQEVTAMFNKYRLTLAGPDSKPHGFGYKYPDRVKIEYLKIPVQALAAKVQLEETKLYEYYNFHREEYRIIEPPASQPDTQPATKPSEPPAPRYRDYQTDVRALILEGLKMDEARNTARTMAKAARSLAAEPETKLQTRDGHRIIPAAWTMSDLAKIAADLQRDPRFGILAEYRKEADWVTLKNLPDLSGIGKSRLALDRDQVFTLNDYVESAQELAAPDTSKEKEANAATGRLASLMLQVGVVSEPLVDSDGNVYLFRLLEAAKAKSPDLVDGKVPADLRPLVEHNIRQQQAYQLLLADKQKLASRVAQDPMDTLAKDYDSVAGVLNAEFTRREFSSTGLVAPSITGVDQDEAFVDRVFEIADTIAPNGTEKIADLPLARRSDAIPVPLKLSIMLVRLDDIKPLRDSAYRQMALSPSNAVEANWILAGVGPKTDTLTLEYLTMRLGYVAENKKDDSTSEGATTEPASN